MSAKAARRVKLATDPRNEDAQGAPMTLISETHDHPDLFIHRRLSGIRGFCHQQFGQDQAGRSWALAGLLVHLTLIE